MYVIVLAVVLLAVFFWPRPTGPESRQAPPASASAQPQSGTAASARCEEAAAAVEPLQRFVLLG
jgi:hypothetical protein